jgi:hypothetical protein
MHKKQQIPISADEKYPEKREIFRLRRNVFKNLNVHGGFHPCRIDSP